MASCPHVMLRIEERSEVSVDKMLRDESLWLRTETGSGLQYDTEQLPRICLYINKSVFKQRRTKKLQQFGKDGKQETLWNKWTLKDRHNRRYLTEALFVGQKNEGRLHLEKKLSYKEIKRAAYKQRQLMINRCTGNSCSFSSIIREGRGVECR